jgi:hypothetical protein
MPHSTSNTTSGQKTGSKSGKYSPQVWKFHNVHCCVVRPRPQPRIPSSDTSNGSDDVRRDRLVRNKDPRAVQDYPLDDEEEDGNNNGGDNQDDEEDNPGAGDRKRKLSRFLATGKRVK